MFKGVEKVISFQSNASGLSLIHPPFSFFPLLFSFLNSKITIHFFLVLFLMPLLFLFFLFGNYRFLFEEGQFLVFFRLAIFFPYCKGFFFSYVISNCFLERPARPVFRQPSPLSHIFLSFRFLALWDSEYWSR